MGFLHIIFIRASKVSLLCLISSNKNGEGDMMNETIMVRKMEMVREIHNGAL
jgi:hypothetical protein